MGMEQMKELEEDLEGKSPKHSKRHGPETKLSPTCWRAAKLATAKVGVVRRSRRELQVRSRTRAGQGKDCDFIPNAMRSHWEILNGGKNKELTLTTEWGTESDQWEWAQGEPLWGRCTAQVRGDGRKEVRFEGGATGCAGRWDAGCVWHWGIKGDSQGSCPFPEVWKALPQEEPSGKGRQPKALDACERLEMPVGHPCWNANLAVDYVLKPLGSLHPDRIECTIRGIPFENETLAKLFSSILLFCKGETEAPRGEEIQSRSNSNLCVVPEPQPMSPVPTPASYPSSWSLLSNLVKIVSHWFLEVICTFPKNFPCFTTGKVPVSFSLIQLNFLHLQFKLILHFKSLFCFFQNVHDVAIPDF